MNPLVRDVRISTRPLRGLLRMRNFGSASVCVADHVGRFSPQGPRGIESNRHSKARFEPLVAPATCRFVALSGGMGGERWQAR